MANMVMYWSPTGGTERVCEILASCLEEAERLDMTVPGVTCEEEFAPELTEEDVCFVAVPSYGGRVPAAALARIRQLEGRGARAVAVAVYGNRDIDDTLLELQDTLAERGFRVAGGISAVAEHSIAREVAAGRPDSADEAQLREIMKEIKKRLASGVCECELPGKRPYKNFGGVPLHPTAGKNCTGCGVCAGECPVGAISLEDPRATAKDMCISCMRCVAICPMQARRPNPVVHETVTLALRAACAKRKDNQWF